MTQGEVGVGQEGAGRLRSTPLPVRAVKLDITQGLANVDGIILTATWHRHLEDDLVLKVQITFRNPEV